MSHICHRGVTLLEVVIVAGLIAVLAAVSLPALTRTLVNQRLETSAQRLATNLRFARMSAVKRKVAFRVVIRSDAETPPNSYEVQYVPPGTGTFHIYPYTETKFEEGITILNTSLDSVTFNARGAATLLPVTATSIDLEGNNNDQYRIDVRTTGAVNVVKIATGG